jgi:hypothetical protein
LELSVRLPKLGHLHSGGRTGVLHSSSIRRPSPRLLHGGHHSRVESPFRHVSSSTVEAPVTSLAYCSSSASLPGSATVSAILRSPYSFQFDFTTTRPACPRNGTPSSFPASFLLRRRLYSRFSPFGVLELRCRRELGLAT